MAGPSVGLAQTPPDLGRLIRTDAEPARWPRADPSKPRPADPRMFELRTRMGRKPCARRRFDGLLKSRGWSSLWRRSGAGATTPFFVSAGAKVEVREEVRQLAEPLAEEHGYELVDIEQASLGHHRVIRIYLDKPGGITLDDCAQFSRRLADAMDMNQIIPGAYHLEVSSPGLERPIRTLEHVKRFAGQRINLHLHDARDGRRRWEGVLLGPVDGQAGGGVGGGGGARAAGGGGVGGGGRRGGGRGRGGRGGGGRPPPPGRPPRPR